MEVDCPNCGSICDVVFDEEQTTEVHPLFCPFCGESVDELFYTEEDEDGDYENDYLEQLLKPKAGEEDEGDILN